MLSPEAKRAPLRQIGNNTVAQLGGENLGKGLRPTTPAKAKAVRTVHGKEHPPHRTNGHMIGEEHVWSEGLVVSPTRTHDMMAGR